MLIIIGKVIACALIGYLAGGLNSAYILGRLKGFDIRTRGTGNAGASNAAIVMGTGAGVICAVFDIFKAFLTSLICTFLFPNFLYASIIGGTCCILGHIFPITMKFRGGKGLATMAGAALAYNWKLFIILLLIELCIIIIIDYICLIPTTGSVMFMAIIGYRHGLLFALIFLPVVLITLVKHIENFVKIRYGVEYRIRMLWKREEEKARIAANKEKLPKELQEKLLEE